MTYQFQCPQGHLMQGDPAQAGQQCHCPTCGMLFIIPPPVAPAVPVVHPVYPAQPVAPVVPVAPPHTVAPPATPYPSAPPPAAPVPAPTPPAAAPPPPAAPQVAPSLHFGPPPEPPPVVEPGLPEPEAPPADEPPKIQQRGPVVSDAPNPDADLLHIPCPKGHELETPRDMLDQDVLCPHCNVQFRLREKDSVEFKRKRRRDSELKERKLGNTWFNWAVVFAVLVIIGLVALLFASSSS